MTQAGVERRTVDAARSVSGDRDRRLAGGTPADNARIVEAVLRGEPGRRRDVVALNAAAALLVAGVVEADGGGRRAGRPDHRRGARRRAARAARRAPSRGSRRPRPSRARRPRQPSRRRSAAGRGSVVHEIAARRARHPRRGRSTSLATQLDAARRRRGRADVSSGWLAPGLHLIAEIKRRLAVGRRIAAAGRRHRRPGARLRAAVARAISVLCEPHWFGGSVDDLARGRAP